MINTNSKICQAIFQKNSQPDCLRWFYGAAILNRFPIAVWRLPNSLKKQAIVDLSDKAEKININLNVSSPGFIFSPFDNQREKSSFLINAHLHLRHTTCSLINESETQHKTAINENKIRFENTLNKITNTFGNKSNGRNYHEPVQWFNNESDMQAPHVKKEEYCYWVEQAIMKIKRAEFEKVVLSRTTERELRKEFDPLILFHNLCTAYPNAFVSLVAIPEIGTWIGATPELLMSVNNDELTAVSLAGTRPVNSNIDNIWRDKELVEQAIVSDYIKECFEQQDISNFTEEGPITVQIGKLQHLLTKFGLSMSSSKMKIDINRFLKDLHPTPAVCGVPKKEALDFIQSNEIHDREFYSGFLGLVNFFNQSQLFVNLRCLQLLKTSAVLYAGSGITIDSVPEQECYETELKLKALLNFLNKIPDVQDINVSSSSKYTVIDRVLCNDSI